MVDETLEGLFQLTRDFARAPGARTIPQAQRAVASKAMNPFAQGSIGKLERVRDGLQTLPFDDGAYGLGTAENPGFFGLL